MDHNNDVCSFTVSEADHSPVAILEFDDSGRIYFSNALFQLWFFKEPQMDLARARADPQVVAKAISLLKQGNEPTPLDKDSKLGARDHFSSWSPQYGDEGHCVTLEYPRTIDPEEHYQMPPERNFTVWVHPVDNNHTSGPGKSIAIIAQMTRQVKERQVVKTASCLLYESLFKTMVEGGRDQFTPGLAYSLIPQHEEIGIGGDFLFDKSVTSKIAVRPRQNKKNDQNKIRYPLCLRVTMVGDAAQPSLVGAMMVRDVGRVLRSICIDNKFSYKQYSSDGFGEIIAREVNQQIFRENENSPSGLDGMIFVTDLKNKHLHMVEGKFEAYVFERGSISSTNIKKYGDMNFGVDGMPKSFGLDVKQNFNIHKCSLTENTVVVTFSDGYRDFFGGVDMVKVLEGCLEAMPERELSDEFSFEEQLLVRLKAVCEPYRKRRVTKEAVARDDQPRFRWDDEIIVVFSPLRREFVG